MKHAGLEYARRAAAWAGIELDAEQETLLAEYAGWLVREAIPAGGLGPGEADRIWPRHIADAFTFAGGWRNDPTPTSLVDIGSGVGLPGIPLAISHRHTAVTLLDRSERRCTQARRAVRLLGLRNVAILRAEASPTPGAFAAATMRAVRALPEAIALMRPLLEPGGIGVMAVSRTRPPEAISAGTILEVPAGVLDSPAWLLRMTAPR